MTLMCFGAAVILRSCVLVQTENARRRSVFRNLARGRTFRVARCCGADAAGHLEAIMNGIIYLIGLIVVIMAILSLFGLR